MDAYASVLTLLTRSKMTTSSQNTLRIKSILKSKYSIALIIVLILIAAVFVISNVLFNKDPANRLSDPAQELGDGITVSAALKEIGCKSIEELLETTKGKSKLRDVYAQLRDDKYLFNFTNSYVFSDKNGIFKILQFYTGWSVGTPDFVLFIIEKNGNNWIYRNDIDVPPASSKNTIICDSRKNYLRFTIEAMTFRNMGGSPTYYDKDTYELVENKLNLISKKSFVVNEK